MGTVVSVTVAALRPRWGRTGTRWALEAASSVCTSCSDGASIEPLHQLARQDNLALSSPRSQILMQNSPPFLQIFSKFPENIDSVRAMTLTLMFGMVCREVHFSTLSHTANTNGIYPGIRDVSTYGWRIETYHISLCWLEVSMRLTANLLRPQSCLNTSVHFHKSRKCFSRMYASMGCLVLDMECGLPLWLPVRRWVIFHQISAWFLAIIRGYNLKTSLPPSTGGSECWSQRSHGDHNWTSWTMAAFLVIRHERNTKK